MARATTRETVLIQGYALREIRRRSRISPQALASQLGVNRSYITKIELGHSKRVSVAFYDALLAALEIEDRRALLGRVLEADELSPGEVA
jgi:transcriptional regulator with XRE-family HTH domain